MRGYEIWGRKSENLPLFGIFKRRKMVDKNHYRNLRDQYKEMFGHEMRCPDDYSKEQMIALHEQCIARRKTYKQLKTLMTIRGLFAGKKFDDYLDEWVQEDMV